MSSFKTYYGMALKSVPEPSQPSSIVHLSVVDKNADTTEAMEVVIAKLHEEYGIGIITLAI